MISFTESVEERYTCKTIRTLVVGSKRYKKNFDRRECFVNAIGLDMIGGEGVDIIHDLETPLIGHGLFDHIDCHSVLEHVQRPWLMCANIEALMREGATIYVSVPFVWRVHGYPSDYWRMTKAALPVLFPNIEWIHCAYKAEGEQVEKPASNNTKTCTFLQKTETLGFGVKRGV